MGKPKVKQEPPDGGWGWSVVFGSSLINLSTRSIEPSFGLLFGDLLKELGVATTGAAVIMSTLDAIVNFSGVFVGPLIKRYSYRKVGLLGALLSGTALMATSTASSMTHILLTYSLIGGLGFGLATASTFVALNSYFVQRRGQAVGLAMAGTALGFMAMPQLISRLLEYFGFRDTMLLLGALSLNALVGAALLQPVKWHTRSAEATSHSQQEVNKLHEKEGGNTDASTSLLGLPRNSSVTSVALNRGSSINVGKSGALPLNSSVTSFAGPRRRKTSTISNVSHLDFMGSTMHIHVETDSENDDYEYDKNATIIINESHIEKGCTKSNNNKIKIPTIKIKDGVGWWEKFVSTMDFDLLMDIKYLNILFGLSITYIAELNFKLIVPFFMQNLGYSKRETAEALSVMAIADITARIIIPPIYDRLSFSRRSTLMTGLVCVSVARSVLAEQTSWNRLMLALVVHGFFRGFALINFPLVISEAVTPEKFPAAFGLSMVSKGIFIVALGPISGWIRDYTGSYSICLHAQSVMILCCVLAWFVEYILTSKKKSKVAQTVEPS